MNEIIKEILSRNPKKILNKKENYILYEASVFGNRALIWKTFEEVLESNWDGLICIRSKKGVDRSKMKYNVKIEEAENHIKELFELGHSEEDLTFNQSMPDEHLLLQGEIMNHKESVYLYYTTVKKPMNLGLAEESNTVEGDEAVKILIENLTEQSLEDLKDLLEEFPASVVEFSAYAIPVGHLAHTGRNTVFWEVRNY
jgi:ribosomal protein L7/L12